MKDDWTNQLRQKLEGHEMAPPAGLWEVISEQTGFTPAPVRPSAVVRRWYWLAAAAAVVALVGFFTLYQQTPVEQPLQAEATQQEAAPSTVREPNGSAVGSASADAPSTVREPNGPAAGSTSTAAPSAVRESNGPAAGSASTAAPSAVRVSSGPAAGSASTAEKVTEETNALADANPATTEEKPVRTEPKKSTLDFDTLPQDYTPAPSLTWSVGVNASAGLLAANTSGAAMSSYMDAAAQNTYPINNVSDTPKEEEYTSKHRLPLSIGLSLHYSLTPRLTLNSGITYTYLYSEFTSQQPPHTTYDQKLHYLGVPLGVSYKLWSANHFQLYVSVGMTLAKCLNDKPWQLSVDGALGAEYNITRQIGLYFEPSLGYYFNDGSSLQHYYKEHPLAPSLQFGVRLHLGE